MQLIDDNDWITSAYEDGGRLTAAFYGEDRNLYAQQLADVNSNPSIYQLFAANTGLTNIADQLTDDRDDMISAYIALNQEHEALHAHNANTRLLLANAELDRKIAHDHSLRFERERNDWRIAAEKKLSDTQETLDTIQQYAQVIESKINAISVYAMDRYEANTE